MKYRFKQDYKYNVNGGWRGRREAKAGDVVEDIPANLISSLQGRGIIEAVGATPSEQKVVAPKEQKVRGKASMKYHGGGYFNILDGHGNQIDQVRGKEEAQKYVEQLNG